VGFTFIHFLVLGDDPLADNYNRRGRQPTT
jgi:hypothetical protein